MTKFAVVEGDAAEPDVEAPQDYTECSDTLMNSLLEVGISPGSLCKSIVMTEGSGRGGRSPFLVFLVFLTPSHLLSVCILPTVSSLLSLAGKPCQAI